MSVLTEEQEATFRQFIDRGNVVVGRPSKIVGVFRVNEFAAGSVIEFGRNVVLRRTTLHFPLGGGKLTFGDDVVYSAWTHVGPNSEIRVGARTVFNREAEIHAWEGASITIGQDCLFSNIKIRTSDMHSIFDLETNERVNRSKSVVIGNKVWLAEAAVVGKGSRIDDGSVVGSNSLVSGYLPPNCVAVGKPARVVRTGIYWTRKLDMSDPVALPATEPPPPEPVQQPGVKDFIRRTSRQVWHALRLDRKAY